MFFDLQPTLTGPLVRLRPLQPTDEAALYEVASDPLIWAQHPAKQRSEPAGFAAFFAESLASGGALVVIDQASGQTIGSSRYAPVAGFPQAIEIGWTYLARAYWGGRYNLAVKTLMLGHAFGAVGHALFYVNEHNLRSQMALAKIGATPVTELDGRPLPIKPLSTAVFRVGREEWAERRMVL
ncbi:MAG: GNAT family N-acetyltransferase [Bernardetiaceae bacterium]|jgi:RimJ/RimL family protein N-acetyltransferase|nr:GNAT family N-acetyltransferase [Bernardetiaceae bacterium]